MSLRDKTEARVDMIDHAEKAHEGGRKVPGQKGDAGPHIGDCGGRAKPEADEGETSCYVDRSRGGRMVIRAAYTT